MMNTRGFLEAVTLLCLSAADVSAADLAKLPRSIAKEPAYKTEPEYCLLVFGPETKTRVWLVQDGDSLYVDRNGNGDLTQPGKKVPAERFESSEEDVYTFKGGDIRDGKLVHKNLSVTVSKIDHLEDVAETAKVFLINHPKPRGYRIMVEMEMPGCKGTGAGGRVQHGTSYMDLNGILQFADRPHDAPIIHFGGPRKIGLFMPHKLTIGRETDVVVGVGTPGIGPGTTAWIDYEGVVPENAYPTIEITYPPQKPGARPTRERYELKRRC